MQKKSWQPQVTKSRCLQSTSRLPSTVSEDADEIDDVAAKYKSQALDGTHMSKCALAGIDRAHAHDGNADDDSNDDLHGKSAVIRSTNKK